MIIKKQIIKLLHITKVLQKNQISTSNCQVFDSSSTKPDSSLKLFKYPEPQTQWIFDSENLEYPKLAVLL
jgi:hypothetical protein